MRQTAAPGVDLHRGWKMLTTNAASSGVTSSPADTSQRKFQRLQADGHNAFMKHGAAKSALG